MTAIEQIREQLETRRVAGLVVVNEATLNALLDVAEAAQQMVDAFNADDNTKYEAIEEADAALIAAVGKLPQGEPE